MSASQPFIPHTTLLLEYAKRTDERKARCYDTYEVTEGAKEGICRPPLNIYTFHINTISHDMDTVIDFAASHSGFTIA